MAKHVPCGTVALEEPVVKLNNMLINSHYSTTVSTVPKVFISLELFHVLSHYNHKNKCNLLGFYVIDQYKVAHNCEVEGNFYK